MLRYYLKNYVMFFNMIDEKKIDKACEKACDRALKNSGFNNNVGAYPYIKGFYDCAKWAINELLKDLWHPASEMPREFAEVLAEAKITESIKTYISFKRNDALFKNWDAYSSGANITRWLYIDDLLPKEGGE